MKHYIELLKANPAFRRITTIQVISYFATWFTIVAVLTMLVDFGISELWIAIVTTVHFIPNIVQAPISGTIIDKFHPKKLLINLLFLEISATLLMLLVDSKELIWLLVILIYIRTSAAGITAATHMSIFPTILSKEDIKLGNEIHSIVWSFGYTAGMFVSGLVVHGFGIQVAIILDALLFASLFFILVPLELKKRAQKVHQSIAGMMRDGLNYMRGKPLLIHMIVVHSMIAFASFDILVTFLAKNSYATIVAVPLAIGIFNGTRALALFLGVTFLSKLLNKENMHRFFYLNALAVMTWALLVDNFYLSLLGNILGGIFNALLWSYTYTLIQKNSDKEYYGRVVSYVDMFFAIVLTLATFFIGWFVEIGIAIDTIIFSIGVVFMLTGVYYRYLLSRYKFNG